MKLMIHSLSICLPFYFKVKIVPAKYSTSVPSNHHLPSGFSLHFFFKAFISSCPLHKHTLQLPLHSLLSPSVFLNSSMRQFIRCLNRVGDSSHYCLLRSESRNSSPRNRNFLGIIKGRRSNGGETVGSVPEGYLPVYVGDEMERFIVNAEFMNHPIFGELLKRSAQEYGYEQQGVLRIPCRVFVFERVLEVMKIGDQNRDLDELLHQFSD